MIALQDYTYDLPKDRIAKFPIEPRDASMLLFYKAGVIEEYRFSTIAELLPKNAFLVFNNTKVIPARLLFQKEKTGSLIELFLLNPLQPSKVFSEAMYTKYECVWICIIGNKKRWKGGPLTVEIIIDETPVILKAELVDSVQNHVRFSWDNDAHFVTIVKALGEIPLPPYLNRKTEKNDIVNYQTVYSEHEGAVAAPTAGLHFTANTFVGLADRNIKHDFLTLHVGAGTFQPIKVVTIEEHQMHSEQIVFTKAFINNLLENLSYVTPIGTTSVRSLESLYWFGVKLLRNKHDRFFIEKLYPYNASVAIDSKQALVAVLDFMTETKQNILIGETEIFIFPGYQFRICKGLITNFHQPDSTLILLVAAMIGDDWRKVYNYALANNFRFLSYGDSSLLLP